MKCEKRIAQEGKENKVVFYIEPCQMEQAMNVVKELEKEEKGIEILS